MTQDQDDDDDREVPPDLQDPILDDAVRGGGARSDRFPTTRRSWITRTLAKGPEGEREVAHFVMSTYLEPLKRYARQIPDLGPIDAEDIVHDFLTNKVGASGYFQQWEASEKPLRRWLVNGFHFRMKDRRRQILTDRRRTAEAGPELSPDVDDDRFASFERDWARDLVHRAVERPAKDCQARDLAEHWRVFCRHHLDTRPYRDLVGEFDQTPRRLARMSRTAADRLRVNIQELLERDGVPPTEIGDEIARLLELVKR